MMEEFKTICRITSVDFDNEVNEALKGGWKFCGAPRTSAHFFIAFFIREIPDGSKEQGG